MKYKKTKRIIMNGFENDGMNLKFGWKFRWYPRLRKQMKQWAKEILEE